MAAGTVRISWPSFETLGLRLAPQDEGGPTAAHHCPACACIDSPLATARFGPNSDSTGTDAVTETSKAEQMTAEAYLARLGERGIDFVFANAGTDFAPIVEGISRNT